MKSGSLDVRSVSSQVSSPGRPPVSTTEGCQSICADSNASFAFSPGWSNQKACALCWKKRICAHSSTGV